MARRLKQFVFDSFDGGINHRELISEIKKNEMYNCVNMQYKGGRLTTREGIATKNTIAIDNAYDISPIGSVTYTDEYGYKLFLLTKTDDIGIYIDLLVVKSDFTYKKITLAEYFNDDYECVLKHANAISFSGKETLLNGCYIVLSIYDENEDIIEKNIIELNSQFSSLRVLNPSDIYAPLISFNGKGDSYTDLPVSKRTFPNPKRLEDFNLISSAFRASFTTDGVSHTFSLPAKNLSNKFGEVIDITYTDFMGTKYNWKIYESQTTSEKISIGEDHYYCVVNRAAGKIMTYTNDGAFPLPMSEGGYNNFVVTAYKQPENDYLFRMNICEAINSRVFVCGYKQKGNVVYFSKQDNPLYFPSSNYAYFGDKTSNIVALKQQNDRLVVFKSNQVGVCSSIIYSKYDVNGIFNGRTTSASALERMDIKTIKSGLGCLHTQTILNCANRLVFLGSDNRIYTITSTSNYMHRFYRISDKIEADIFGNDFDNAFAVDYDGNYMLFTDSKSYLFDYNSSAFLSASSTSGNRNSKDNIAWFYFEYALGEAKPFMAMNFNGVPIIIANIESNTSEQKMALYTFYGDKDYKALSESTFMMVDIPCEFTTAASEFKKDEPKKIVGVEITFLNENFIPEIPISISYLNENKVVKVSEFTPFDTSKKEVIIKKTPCIFGVKHFGMKFERLSSFGIKQIKIIYKS